MDGQILNLSIKPVCTFIAVASLVKGIKIKSMYATSCLHCCIFSEEKLFPVYFIAFLCDEYVVVNRNLSIQKGYTIKIFEQ